MLLLTIFTALSALLAVAIPLPACHLPTAADLDSCSTLYRRAPPKFEIPLGFAAPSHKQDALDKMREHYETKSTDEQKRARLASSITRWQKLPRGREHMKFNYHEGDTTGSPVIGPPVEIFRDKPVPKIHFGYVPKEHQEDMSAEGLKRYNDLGYGVRSRVKSMKVWGEWHPNGGIRENTKFTFHTAVKPNGNNIFGNTMTLYRPLTLQLPDVPLLDKMTIEQSVRAAHRKMIADPQHPASKSNYGIVHSGWHNGFPDANGGTHEQVVVGLEEVSEEKKRRVPLGNYAVDKGISDHESFGLNAGSPSSHTGTSHGGPSSSNNEVSRPSNSHEQQHMNVGSLPTHALNPGPLHLSNQGTSQFSVGSRSSHAGSSHPESLHAASPHPNQPWPSHTDSPPQHDAFYMPSPELWRPWDPASQPSHGSRQSLHPDLYSDQLWRVESPHPDSPLSNSHILSHPNSPSSQFNTGGPSSHTGGQSHLNNEVSHPSSSQEHMNVGSPSTHVLPSNSGSPPDSQRTSPFNASSPSSHLWSSLLHSASPDQLLQFHADSPYGLSMPPPGLGRPWDPVPQLSHETLHPDLHGDQLWRTDSPRPNSPPSNSQILHHPNSQEQHHLNIGSPSTHALLPNPGLLHLNSQGSSQLNSGSLSPRPGSSHYGLLPPVSPYQPLHFHMDSPYGFSMPSPEVGRPWDPVPQLSHETLHPDLHGDQLWRTDSPRPNSPPSNSQILHHPNSQEQHHLNIGSPSMHALLPNPGLLHLNSQRSSHYELLLPVSPYQPLQFHADSPYGFSMPSPEVGRPWDPVLQLSHETLHPDLHGDQLWRSKSPRLNSPPSNSQILHHPNSQEQHHLNIGSPSTHALLPNPGLLHLNSQGSSQLNSGSLSSRPGSSHYELLPPVSPYQPLHFHMDSPYGFSMPSPEVGRPWDPVPQLSHETLHPDLHGDQLWRAELPHPISPPLNSQILSHPNSQPSHPGLSYSDPAQSSSTVLPSQQLAQIGPSADPSGFPDANLSPEIWNILNPDPVYPYPWQPHQHSP